MIESVRKALGILSFVARQDERPVTLTRIAQGVGIPAATCAHLVETLCAENYLEKVSRREGYIMGPQMHVNTTQRLYHHRLIELASPIMMRLCRDLSESVSISTMSGERLYVPYSIHYREERISHTKTLPGLLYQSASGRVFLAHMTDGELTLLLSHCGLPEAESWPGAQTRPDLEAQLAKIRTDGVCVARRVREHGTSAVSCPVYEEGTLIAAMGTALPDERLQGEHMEQCIQLTKEAARKLSRRLNRTTNGEDGDGAQ